MLFGAPVWCTIAALANPTLRRTAVLLIRDNRSRTVCSVLLRHEGVRVLEARTADDVLLLAAAEPVDLVIADLESSEQATLHRELRAQQPRVECLSVRERLEPEVMAKEIRSYIRGEPRDDGSRF
jgi:DNA-binding response OmpR family regulator